MKRLILASLLVVAFAACALEETRTVSAQTIEVYKYTGAVQCGTAGVSVDVMEKTLTMNGIDVLSSFCGYDGYLRSAVCGNGTGLINVYGIERQFLQPSIADLYTQ